MLYFDYTLWEAVMNVRIVKWGNSLGFRIPKALADDFDLYDGSELDVQVQKRAKLGKQIILQQRKPDLDSLLDGIEGQMRPAFTEFGAIGKEVL
jgi:antitoxin component of MazEF toxin-antitoxin module